MKKILIILTLSVTVINVQAQNLSFGLTGGIGHSWTSLEKGTADRLLHPSYNIGGRMVYSFVTSWGISADLKFSSEGQSVGTDADNRVAYRANYLRIPLQGIYFFGNYGDRVRPKISLGPSFGILLGGKVRGIDEGEEVSEAKAKTYIKGGDFGFTIAGGGNVRIATATWLNLDLSYYHGLTDIAKSGENGKNRNLGINVGVTFPLATLRPEKLKQ